MADPCEWCDGRASGTAEWQGDGKRHPSCGEHGHGFDFAEYDTDDYPGTCIGCNGAQIMAGHCEDCPDRWPIGGQDG